MRRFTIFVVAIATSAVLATAPLAAAQDKKAPARNQAGQVNAPTIDVKDVRTKAITGNWSEGWHCATVAPGVHNLGFVPGGRRVVVDFEHLEGSDPTALLITVSMSGSTIGEEAVSSDDTGGNLNPKFDVTRSYDATYILTVSEFNDNALCYSFKMTLF